MARTNEQLAILKEHGLTEYASRAYLALLKAGTVDARQLATTSGIPVAKIYPTIRQLQTWGLVEVAPESPKRYTALPFSNFVALRAKEYAEKARALEIERERLDALFPLKAEGTLTDRGRISLVKGRRNSTEKWRALAQDCQREILILAADQFSGRVARILPLLSDLHARGVRVRILARMHQDDMRALGATRNVAEIRNKDIVRTLAANVSLSIFDGSHGMVVNVIPDDDAATQGDDIAMVTDILPTVRLLQDLVEGYWREAETLEAAVERYRAERKAAMG